MDDLFTKFGGFGGLLGVQKDLRLDRLESLARLGMRIVPRELCRTGSARNRCKAQVDCLAVYSSTCLQVCVDTAKFKNGA